MFYIKNSHQLTQIDKELPSHITPDLYGFNFTPRVALLDCEFFMNRWDENLTGKSQGPTISTLTNTQAQNMQE